MPESVALEPRRSAPGRLARTRDRAAGWLGRAGDAAMLRLLARLRSSSSGVHLMTPDELERSLGLLRCYTDPHNIAEPERIFAPAPQLPVVQTRSRKRVRGGLYSHYTFATPYTPLHHIYAAEYRRLDNLDTVHLWAWQHARPPRGAILVTHGWGLGHVALHDVEFGLRRMFRDLGLDVYFYVMPFHWLRRPSTSRFSGELHPSPNLMRTNEAFIQKVRELRTAIAWIVSQRDTPLGMMGSGLGGYTTALLASLERRLSFAIPVLPPASLADLFWEQAAHDSMRAHAERIGMTHARFARVWALHCPMSYSPKVPHEGRMIVTASHDGLVTEAHAGPLWEHWGRCRRFQFAGGHLLQVRRRDYHREVGRFLDHLGLTRR